MKISKAMLPALAMLILTAVMLSTASYAWFAMGSEVSATNMNVSIKSDSTYIVISKDLGSMTDGTGKVQDGFTTQSVDFKTDPATELYPVAFGTYTATTEGDKTTYSDITPYNAGTYDFNASNVWYTMQGKSAADGTGKVDTFKPIESGDIDEYVLYSTVYVAVSKGSQAMENLRAKIEFSSVSDDAVNVLIVATAGGTKTYYRYQAIDAGKDYVSGNVLAEDLTDTPVKVEIYVFYDGTCETITTNEYGLDNIKDTSVTVKFTADSVA